MDQSLGEIRQISDVNTDFRVKPEAIITGQHKVGPSVANTPQRRAEPLSRALVRAIPPKNAGHPCPGHWPLSQGKVGQHTLGTVRNPQLLSTDNQLELPHQS